MHTTSIKKNKILMKNDYPIIEKIGSGSFGEVYLAYDKKNDIYVAAKVEEKTKDSRIMLEYKIYRRLERNGFTIGIPKIYEFMQTPIGNIMIMQLLGANLEQIFNIYGRKFTLQTVLYLADQIIYLLSMLHNAKFIHRDIKPDNFLVGRDNDVNSLYIMDFGLSKQYINRKGEHIKYDGNRSLIGTIRYASINMH